MTLGDSNEFVIILQFLARELQVNNKIFIDVIFTPFISSVSNDKFFVCAILCFVFG